jgi:type IV pilus assembly protein PilZ
MQGLAGARSGILSLSIKDKAVLYAAYMPFVKHGGLFIPTTKSYKLGDEVFMLLSLMDEPEKIPVAGKVVWVTPTGAQGNRAAGIGVQFSDQDNTAVSKIETYLAGSLESDRRGCGVRRYGPPRAGGEIPIRLK